MTGMLSMSVRSYLREPRRPVVFVPVYFGYERVFEGPTYLGELSGKPKEKETVRGLLREDLFTVVSEHFVTDTARYADLVLPATMQAEQLDIMVTWGHLYISLNQPAISAPG